MVHNKVRSICSISLNRRQKCCSNSHQNIWVGYIAKQLRGKICSCYHGDDWSISSYILWIQRNCMSSDIAWCHLVLSWLYLKAKHFQIIFLAWSYKELNLCSSKLEIKCLINWATTKNKIFNGNVANKFARIMQEYSSTNWWHFYSHTSVVMFLATTGELSCR